VARPLASAALEDLSFRIRYGQWSSVAMPRNWYSATEFDLSATGIEA
jgi:hypothetical protein